jgi:hypothetical protein
MDKKLYDELVNRNIITDTFMTLEKINERGIKLENIITQPEMYKIFSKYVSNEEVVEPITQPDKNEETQPTQPAPVVEPEKETEVETEKEVEPEKEAEVEPVKEEEGIVVDDNVVPEPTPEPTPEAPKTKSKKSKEVVSE